MNKSALFLDIVANILYSREYDFCCDKKLYSESKVIKKYIQVIYKVVQSCKHIYMMNNLTYFSYSEI